jgi:hypothetical protein
VTGTIADEHGRPIAGAPVTLAGTNSDRARFGGAGGHERGGFYVNRRGTRTDSLGRFHLRDVAPGHYKLEARVDELEDRLVGSSSVEAQPLSLQVGRQAAREQEDFVIPLGRQLVGRVMAPSGAVPPSVTITYTVDGASDGHKPLLVRPGKTFRLFRLSEGELALEAAPCSYLGEPLPTEGGPRGVVRHAVRSLAGTVWICLEEDGWVQAFVVDGNGAPVPGARVAVLGADGREIASRASDARGSAAFFVGKAAEVTVVAEPQHADGVAGGAGSGVTAVKSPVVKAGTSNVELVLR